MRALPQGYLIVRGCLVPDRLARMRAAVDAEFTLTKENTRFGFRPGQRPRGGPPGPLAAPLCPPCNLLPVSSP